MINYSKVQVTWNSSIVPPGKAATTIGNVINVKGNWISNTTLIHELTHVWQYQSGKYSIMEMASISWLGAMLGLDIYSYSITTTSKFENYTLEQQAKIVEDCAAGGAAACGLLEKSKYAFSPFLDNLLIAPISIWDPLYPKIGPERTGIVIVEEPDEPTPVEPKE